jgi:tRNA(fMet)-specific endonuclease VapC
LIVDTNALSAIVDGEPAIAPVIEEAELLAISVITLGEYRFGISQSARRTQHEAWLRENLRRYRIFDITGETSGHYAQLRLALKRAGTPIPSNDLWIAALCRQHNLPLLSRDAHFDRVTGLRRLTW